MTAGSAGLEAALASRNAPVSAGRIEGPREETSLLAFFGILLQNRRLIGLCGLIGTLIFAAFSLSQAARFESRASFIVKGAATPVQLPNTATSFGLVLTAYADFAQSVVFYADLAAANVILRTAAEQSYATSKSHGQKIPLPEILGIKTSNHQLAVDRAVRQLSKSVSSFINTRSGVVSISVASPDPLVAQELASKILSEMEIWSKTRAHTQAVKEREFTQSLVDDAQAKLTQAEDALNTFLVTNRMWASPELTIEHNRLSREVDMRQQVYTALAESLEQAKIEEGRDRSAINIVEVADLPVEPQRVAALRRTIIGLSAGLLVGMILAFLRQRADEKKLLAA